MRKILSIALSLTIAFHAIYFVTESFLYAAEPTATEPTTAEEWFKKGNFALGAENHKDAIDAYTKSIKLKPSFGAYNNLAFEYIKLGNYQKAIEDFTKAIELNPKSIEAYRMRGNTYDSLGNHEQALKDYAKYKELQNAAATLANRNKTPEQRACEARLFAYLMAISDNPANVEKAKKLGERIAEMLKKEPVCEVAEKMDKYFLNLRSKGSNNNDSPLVNQK